MEANNPKKFWKIAYFFLLSIAVYAAIAGMIVNVQSGNVGIGVVTEIVALYVIWNMSKKFKS